MSAGFQRQLSHEREFVIYLQEAAYSSFQRNEPLLTETMINTFTEKCDQLELDKDMVIHKYLNALQEDHEELISHASKYAVRVLSLSPVGGKLSNQILAEMKQLRFRAIRNSVLKILSSSDPKLIVSYSDSFIGSVPLNLDRVGNTVLIDDLLQMIESCNHNEHFVSVAGKRLSRRKNWRMTNGALLKVLTSIIMCENVSPECLHLDLQNSCVGPAPSGLLGALDVIVQRNIKLWLDLPWGTQGSLGCAPSAAHDVLLRAVRRQGARATLERLTASIGATAVGFLPLQMTHLSLQLDAIGLKHLVGHLPKMQNLRSLSVRIPESTTVPGNLSKMVYKGDMFVLHLPGANDEHLDRWCDLASLCYSQGWYRQVHLEDSRLTSTGQTTLRKKLYQNGALYDQVIYISSPKQVSEI